MSAIKTGNQNIAQDILEDQAVALENSGDKEGAFNSRRMKAMISKDQNAIYSTLGLFGNAVSPDEFGPMMDKFGAGVRADQMQPLEMAKNKAETAKINAEANDIPLAAEDRKQGVVNQGTKIEYDNQYNYDKLGQDQQQFIAGLDSTERIAAAKLRAAKNETSIQRVERLEKVENFANAAQTAAEASKNAARLANLANENSGAYWDRLVRQVPGTSNSRFKMFGISGRSTVACL